jgi:lactate racemase
MNHFDLAYGETKLGFELPNELLADLINPSLTQPAAAPIDQVKRAISSPLGNVRNEYLKCDEHTSVVIAVNDKTRPVPHGILLPPLLDYLQNDLGIKNSNIRFIIASGTHYPMKPDDYHLTLPESIINFYDVSAHDCDDEKSLIFIGKTKRNTPIRINAKFMSADLKIVVGNIEPHHFAGFSGGTKTAAIGLTARETIRANHSLLLDDRATIASFDQNPLRQDIEDIGERIGVDLALNAVLNSDGNLVKVLFGKPSEVIRQGIEISKSVCQTPVNGLYDLVIASGGGYPKDINFYQAQKAISHACTILKNGGLVILAAECREGIGSPGMERFMKEINSLEDIPKKFQSEGFRVGPHKALLLYRQLSRIKIILVSSLDSQEVKKLFMIPAGTMQTAVSTALTHFSIPPRIAVMPHAINTIPNFE